MKGKEKMQKRKDGLFTENARLERAWPRLHTLQSAFFWNTARGTLLPCDTAQKAGRGGRKSEMWEKMEE